ncbi:MAG TPA: cation:proton antiporter [Actinocrinis sp.]|jgi:CPA1 family monovalent cation:H+ antiporter
MTQLTLLFVVFLATILSVPVSARLGLPAPVLMTVFGVGLALIPSIPNPSIEPELILPLVLPPLLFAAARRTHWRQFKAIWQAILLLAVILVLVSTAAVAAAFRELAPGVPLAAAVLLGALASPPDPVAAVAVAGDVGLPRRLISILETEGLFNDVTAIVIYSVAVQAVVSGHFSTPVALADLALSAVTAIVIGLATGWIAARLMGFLGDATLQVALTLLIPYAAYVIADQLHGSGVLSVLLCGLYLSDRTDADDVAYRLVGTAFWDIVELLVTGFAFGLIGQELHSVVDEVGDRWTAQLGDAMTIVGVVVVVRLLWLLPAGWLSKRLERRRTARAAAQAPPGEAGGAAGPDGESADEAGAEVEADVEADDEDEPGVEAPISWQETVVMWWAGMRGVATVALALAVPLTVDGGAAFPGREQILFTAFVVVLFTLVVQGLTLPVLVRLLRVGADDRVREEAERQLWLRVARAELVRLDELAETGDLPDGVYERLAGREHVRLAINTPDQVDDELRAEARRRRDDVHAARRVEQEMIAAARREMYAARAEPDVDPALVDKVLRRLDLRSERH